MHSNPVVSHKWVHQVLRQRGIPAPAPERIRLALEKATPDILQRILRVGTRVEAGADGGDDIDILRSLIAYDDATDQSPTELSVEVAHTDQPGEKRAPTYSEEKPTRQKHHVYGLKAALTVEVDRLRELDADGNERWTVLLEAAASKGNKRYDWESKIAFQFMRRELPLLAATLLGQMKHLELRNHGQSANKFVQLDDQQDKVFVKVGQGSRVIGVPVVGADVHAWLELVLLVMRKNAPEIGDTMQLAMIQRVADMENRKKSNG